MPVTREIATACRPPLEEPTPHRSTDPTVYELWRAHDVSGVSGTGLIAHLTSYPSGKVTVAWCGEVSSVSVYNSLNEVLKIHGHNGSTELVRIFPNSGK